MYLTSRYGVILILILGFLVTGCASENQPVASENMISYEQDTLKLEPDFSYEVKEQKPHIFVDQVGYGCKDKKIAYFNGVDLQESFRIIDMNNGETVYEGTIYKVKALDDNDYYVGDFSRLTEDGIYMLEHPELGNSYIFEINDLIYREKFQELQDMLKDYQYDNVSDLAYVLANMMFNYEVIDVQETDFDFLRDSILLLMNSQNEKTGAFCSEIFTMSQIDSTVETQGTISLTTTAQMAGVLAEYSIISLQKDADLSSRCITASQKAYRYLEQHIANTDTDAWYYAAVQLYRATGRQKYLNAIAEYDKVDSSLYSHSQHGYTIMADFVYLSTPRGTDYTRCTNLLDGYMDRAHEISLKSLRENFYVLENVDTMEIEQILDEIIVLGIINKILSGQEYAGIQRNYMHYLSGVNNNAYNYIANEITDMNSSQTIDITKASKLLSVYATMSK